MWGRLMFRAPGRRAIAAGAGLIGLLTALALGVLLSDSGAGTPFNAAFRRPLRRLTRQPQLVSVQPLPAVGAPMCEWMSASATSSLRAMRAQERGSAGAAEESNPLAAKQAEVRKRAPLRMIRDPYSAFSSVAVDPVNNEVVFTDENLFQILVYDRTASTPATARMSEPKRAIAGMRTKIEFQCGVYVDPKNGDIYAVNNDSVNTLVIFDRQAKGDVPPTREIATPDGTYGIAVDEAAQEIFLAVQHDSAVIVYNKNGQREDPPIRLLQGDHTQLADPHGMAIDTKRQLMFVGNFGSRSRRAPQPAGANQGSQRGGRGQGKPNWPLQRSHAVPGSGTFSLPSITVYPLKAQGDAAPLRVLQGPKTQLNMPSHLFMDEERGELFVANDMGQSILVFDSSASGDAAPKRILTGPRTMIRNPTGVFVDFKNDELWVANFGNHVATVYPRAAAGDTPPLRMIRSGPLDSPGLMIGNPGAVGYDTKREEILVPN